MARSTLEFEVREIVLDDTGNDAYGRPSPRGRKVFSVVCSEDMERTGYVEASDRDELFRHLGRLHDDVNVSVLWVDA